MKRLAFILALALSGAAHAYTGDELHEDCKVADEFFSDVKTSDPYQSLKSARCISYVAGFADGYSVGDFLGNKVGIALNAFCLPHDPDLTRRLVRAVYLHLEHMPPKTTASTATLVAGALAKAFPCGN